MRYLSLGKNAAAIVIAVSLATIAGGAKAEAQQATSNGHPIATNTPLPAVARVHTPKKPAADAFGKVTLLTADKVQFDDIPQYTGKAKFATGSVFGADRPGADGALTVVSYCVSEPRDQVKEWYANALRMYGWDITFQSASSMTAVNSKTGNSAVFQFGNQDRAHRGQSMLQIDYHKSKH